MNNNCTNGNYVLPVLESGATQHMEIVLIVLSELLCIQKTLEIESAAWTRKRWCSARSSSRRSSLSMREHLSNDPVQTNWLGRTRRRTLKKIV